MNQSKVLGWKTMRLIIWSVGTFIYVVSLVQMFYSDFLLRELVLRTLLTPVTIAYLCFLLAIPAVTWWAAGRCSRWLLLGTAEVPRDRQ
jgi:hypothetical protein